MTQNTSGFSEQFITDKARAKARVKYEIKQLESRLAEILKDPTANHSSDEVQGLISSLFQNYYAYFNLIQLKNISIEFDSLKTKQPIHCFEHMNKAAELRKKLNGILSAELEERLVTELTCMYYMLANNKIEDTMPSNCNSNNIEPNLLRQLFTKDDLKDWLFNLIDIWNFDNKAYEETSLLFSLCSKEDYEKALSIFSKPEFIDFINAAFFYKLYPDKLFDELIHPEKLVSVRMRVGLLHEIIEQLQEQSYNKAMQFGLKSNTDMIFHGDELPQGILIEVDPKHTDLLKLAIKALQVKYTPESDEQINIERLHDLRRAYKYWFNPNRLIDAVMVLLQRLVQDEHQEERTFTLFNSEMIVLYLQLTTTECLDLYGYFSNDDSASLLHTLELIIAGKHLDGLPPLRKEAIKAIQKVYKALLCVMEGLRTELKNRHISTDPYPRPDTQSFELDQRNRDAAYRIIEVYGCEIAPSNDLLEKLFSEMEGELNQ